MGTPVGTWDAQAVRPRGTTVTTLHFTPTGRVFLGGAGAGTWTRTAPDRFSYQIAEPLFDETGTYEGWVDIRQLAVQSGLSFASAGTSAVHKASGELAYQVPVTVTARAGPRRAGPLVG